MKSHNSNEIMKNSLIPDLLVEQIFKDNGFIIQNKFKMDIGIDMIAKKDGKEYAVEVKRGNFDIGKMYNSANRFMEAIKKNNYIPVLVIFSIKGNQIKEKIKEKFDINVIDISNLLYLVSKNQIMKDKLVSLLSFSTENIIEKEIDFDIDLKQYPECKERDYGFCERLDAIAKGNENSTEYEGFCIDVLKYLFNDSLSLWEEQKKSNEDLYRFDLICKIKNGIQNEFFNTIEKYYLSKYIIFEFKNYSDQITQREIYTTEKYLYKTALRTVAIIITRDGVDKNGMKAIKGSLRQDGKLMIVLNDSDLKQMILLKESGEDYTEILINKLDSMLVTLEK